MKSFKFKYSQIAILKKGTLFGVFVNVGIKFDSKVNCKKNPSKISYYIEGYEIRDWCFQEELLMNSFFIRIIVFLFKIKKRFKK
jgi:hypothetical protein